MRQWGMGMCEGWSRDRVESVFRSDKVKGRKIPEYKENSGDIQTCDDLKEEEEDKELEG